MNKLNTFQKILIWILTAFFSLTIVLVIFKEGFVVDVNEKVFNVVTAIRYTFVEAPIYAANDNFDSIIKLQNVSNENKALRENVLSIGRLQAEMEELETKNKNLQDMLDFKSQNSNLKLIPSQVVFRDVDRWNTTLKLNVGSDDNIKVNDAVVVPQGYIGRVESVTAKTSVVRLLISTDVNNKVAAKIMLEDGISVQAIVDSYNVEERAFELSLLETSDKIEVGNKVVTSGAGGVIPGGILVGEVRSLEASVNKLENQILVKSSVNFAAIEDVFVVVGENND